MNEQKIEHATTSGGNGAKMNEIRTLVLLEKSYRLLQDTKEAMDSHKGGYGEECPFCMGELFDNGDIELITFIDDHLRNNSTMKTLAAASSLMGYAQTCMVNNQPGWVKRLVDYINNYAEAIGDNSRFEFDGDSIVRADD